MVLNTAFGSNRVCHVGLRYHSDVTGFACRWPSGGVYRDIVIDLPWHAQIPWFLGQWKALIARVHAQRVLGSSSFPQMLRVCALVLVHAHAKSPTCMGARAARLCSPARSHHVYAARLHSPPPLRSHHAHAQTRNSLFAQLRATPALTCNRSTGGSALSSKPILWQQMLWTGRSNGIVICRK